MPNCCLLNNLFIYKLLKLGKLFAREYIIQFDDFPKQIK